MYRILSLLLMMGFSLFAQQAPRTVIVVRHAERAGGMSPDVGISEEGRQRAQRLAAMLADAGVKVIYTTEVVRTQQTAAPLAGKLELKAEVIPAKDVEGLVGQLRTGSGTALVVGHSDTVPEIIRRLGAGTVPSIADTEYDRLFIVTLSGPREATLLTLHYPAN